MYRMTPVVKNLLIINLLCFMAQQVMWIYGLSYVPLALHAISSGQFALHQLLTYMFLHGSWEHLFFNMFALWMFGRIVESRMGSRRFLIYYLVCGVGAGLVQLLVQSMAGAVGYTVGASGAVYALLLAFGMFFPDDSIFIFPIPIPIKAKYYVIGLMVVELLMSRSNDGVAHFAHLGGILFGFLLILYWRHKGGRGGRTWRYGSSGGKTWSERIRDLSSRVGQKVHTPHTNRYQKRTKTSHQEEIQQILDKVKKNGYESLTNEEKKKLFGR